MPCPEGKTSCFQGQAQGTNVLLWPSVPDSRLCVPTQSPGTQGTPGNGRNNHWPSSGGEQLSSMQVFPNYVKGLSASDTRLQSLKESKPGKIKESWSVGQHQPENKPKESLRSTTALGHSRTSWWSSLTVPKGNGGREEAVEWPCTHLPQLCAPLFPDPHLHLHKDARAQAS